MVSIIKLIIDQNWHIIILERQKININFYIEFFYLFYKDEKYILLKNLSFYSNWNKNIKN